MNFTWLLNLFMTNLFIYVSYKFVLKFGQGEFEEIVQVLKKYPHIMCPKGYQLYRLQDGNSVYRIQVQKDITHRKPNTFLQRCEKNIVYDNSTCNVIDDPSRSCTVLTSADSAILRDVCDRLQYNSKLADTHDSKDEHPTKSFIATVVSVLFSYLTEIVYRPTYDVRSGRGSNAGDDDGGWNVQTLLYGIFPGTLWCGFGNIADDMYKNLGQYNDTDLCCRSHDLCEPKIRAMQKRYYYNNQGIIPVSHCSCDLQFYNCLKKVNSSASNKIGKIFFTMVKMKCFDFDIRDVCAWEFMGICLKSKQKCAAVLKNSPNF